MAEKMMLWSSDCEILIATLNKKGSKMKLNKQEKEAMDRIIKFLKSRVIPTTIFLITSLLLFSTNLVFAATYYVRPDGGTAAQCTGLVDKAVSADKNCAFQHPFWAIAPVGNNPTKLAGGDTLIIDGNSMAQYIIGYGAPNTADTSKCHSTYPWDCYLRAVPSGPDAAHPTRILGKGWDTNCSNPPQLWGTERARTVLNLTGSKNVELQCLDITDHSDCQEMGPKACKRDGSGPFGPWATNGLIASDSSNVFIKNVNIHGMAYRGVYAGRLKDWTIEDSKIIANYFVGWDGDIGVFSSNSGIIKFTRVQIKFNGCGETYPSLTPYNCSTQDQGGYGDGIGTQLTGGVWIFEDSDVSQNTSDGLDLLYHDGNGAVNIKRSKFIGNAGNQVKSAANTIIEDSQITGNCNFFMNNPIALQLWNGKPFNHCRAGGDTIAIQLRPGSKHTFVNTKIDSVLNIGIMTTGASCVGTETVSVDSNTTFELKPKFTDPGSMSVKYYAAGASPGNGGGPCGLIKLTTFFNPAPDPIPDPTPDPQPTPEPIPEPEPPTCPDPVVCPLCPPFSSQQTLTATQFGSVKSDVYDRADRGEIIYMYHSTRKAVYEFKLHQLKP